MLIYMLYDYQEHGAEKHALTTNPAQLPGLYKKLWPWYCESHPVQAAAELDLMQRALVQSKPRQYNLSRGWGGVVLLIAEDGVVS